MPTNAKTEMLDFEINNVATCRELVSQFGINGTKIYYQAMQDITARLEKVCYEYYNNEISCLSTEYKVGRRMGQFLKSNQIFINCLAEEIKPISKSSHDLPDL